jgi:hypothetical protein
MRANARLARLERREGAQRAAVLERVERLFAEGYARLERGEPFIDPRLPDQEHRHRCVRELLDRIQARAAAQLGVGARRRGGR